MTDSAADDTATTPTLNVRQAAFIGVGAMVGAGIFALLGSAGEVAGAAVWISFLIAGAIAGLQGYSFAKFGARYPSAGGLLEYVVRGFGNGHATGDHRLVDPRRQRHRDGHGRRVLRQLCQLGRGRRKRGVGQGVRRRRGARHDDTQRDRVTGRGESSNRRRRRRHRDPHRVRRLDPGQPRPGPAGVQRLPGDRRHRVQRGADVLRLPRVRRRHVHRQGPGQPGTTAPSGAVPRARHRHRDLRRRRAGRVRHAHRARGHRLRRDRPGGRRRTDARSRRLLDDDGDGTLRHGRCDQLRPLPGGRTLRADDVHRASSRRSSVAGSAAGSPPASWSQPSSPSSSPSGSISRRSPRSAV